MHKISLRELNKSLRQCGIGINSDEIETTPYFTVCHNHVWDHGYDGFFGIIVNEDGSFKNDTDHSRTRREFYADMREMISFLLEYFREKNIQELVIAPCFRHNQFSFRAERNDIYDEIYNFIRSNNVRKGERSGIVLTVSEDVKVVEMVIEGAFRGISELCLFAPSESLLIVPDHHFCISFWTC